MATKQQKLNAEKDADLLKAVVQASGGISGGSAFWKEVASAMEEDVNGEAARKRFDKFKPGANPSNSKAKLNSEKDADLLKAVIKVNGGVGKGKAFWETVAGAMEENINAEAARKRFEKFKVPRGKGEEGGEKAAGVKKEPKKRAIAKPKTVKGAGKGSKGFKVGFKDGSDKERQDEAIDKVEDDIREGIDDGAATEKTVKQATKSLDEYVSEGKGTVTNKRAWVEEWSSNVSSTGAGDEETFEVVTPVKPTTKPSNKKAKKMRVEAFVD
jgi:hypothetical protein